MRIFEVMNTTVHIVAPPDSAENAWQLMHAKGIRHLVVKDGSTVVGVLSDSDAGGRYGAAIRAGTTVGELMDRHVVSVTREETLRKAANLMASHLIGCLPVIEDGRLVGVVTVLDILKVVGHGIDRPGRDSRPDTHHRVPHRKVTVASGRW
jgi:acetoin utilization protein AcuB